MEPGEDTGGVTDLSEDKGCVMLEEDLPIPYGIDRGWATTEQPLAGLLRGGVHHLPTPHPRGKVHTSHPAVIPHMEVPTNRKGKIQ